jgi:hypothetical protein
LSIINLREVCWEPTLWLSYIITLSKTLVHRSRIFLLFSSTLKMEAIRSSKTSVNTISTWWHIPDDCFLYSHHRETLKSYNMIEVPHIILPQCIFLDACFHKNVIKSHNTVATFLWNFAA